MVDREDKRTNNRTMLPTLKDNTAVGYQGPVKIKLLKGAGASCSKNGLLYPVDKMYWLEYILSAG